MESKIILASDAIKQHYDIKEGTTCDVIHAVSLMMLSEVSSEACDNIKSIDDGVTKIVYRDNATTEKSGIIGISAEVANILKNCLKCGEGDVLMYTY
jgi:hypothetical protein